MTVGAWILWGIISAVLIFAGIFPVYWNTDSIKKAVIGGCFGLVLCSLLFMAFHWYYSSTAKGARALKSQESNFNKGIERWVGVYDVTGNLVREYRGKFDIEYDDDRILFDDENNLRHIIYYPTGTVVIDEIGE